MVLIPSVSQLVENGRRADVQSEDTEVPRCPLSNAGALCSLQVRGDTQTPVTAIAVSTAVKLPNVSWTWKVCV
ncbi:hypothetical protein JZ751_002027 [Albula glossodonta]|uniref:Uncharacterized protein n=1 Tax=Albula glossodonta TaxID=121402 RepID=A0A8T2PF82_9TELE|nr:hypothetical protein JZ751_002027 [Albula glossodonta]